MKKHFLRSIATVMTIVLLLTAAPLSGFAKIDWPEQHLPELDFSNLFSTTAKAATSGTCGENLTWVLDDDGTLTISGTGAMTDYSYFSSAPWHSNRDSIKKVVIENGVTSIGSFAFYLCENMISATTGNRVMEIEYCAFAACISLASITISDRMSNIATAFSNCPKLRNVYYSGTKENWDKIYINKYDNDALLDAELTFNFNDTCAHAFDDGIISLKPTIEEDGCKILTCSLCGKTFEKRIKLTETGTCGNASTWELYSDGTLIISGTGDMFDYYSRSDVPWYSVRGSIRMVIIEDGITRIGSYSFAHCYHLSTVVMSNDIIEIGAYAFSQCWWLLSVNIPTNLKYISSDSFYQCLLLKSITIPESVTAIYDDAFNECENLENIFIPKSLTNITDNPFAGCTSLNIMVDDDNPKYTSVDGILYDKNKESLLCYPASKDDETFTIPNTVKTIKESAFEKCYSLISVIIPTSVTSIGDWTFYYCTSLTSVTIGNSVTSIGDYAFYNCRSLTSITIPDSVTSIGSYAFSDCQSLTSITIPDSVTSIGNYAFYNTAYYNDTSNWDNSVLYISNHLIKAKSDVSGNCAIKNGAKTIASYAFSSCTSLTSITIPDSVTSIGNYAFYNCTSLTSVTIPNSVTSIGYSAFDNCTSLTSVTIPDSVTNIGNFMFCGCTSLTSVTIPNSVTSIGHSAFYNCTSLSDVYYTGSEEEWKKISIGFNNTPLTNATIHYDYNYSDNLPENTVINIGPDLIFLGIDEYCTVDAFSPEGENITDQVTWSNYETITGSCISIESPGYIKGVKEGLSILMADNDNDKEVLSESGDSCRIYVGQPNSVEYNTVFDTEYYYSNGGFISNVSQISNSVEVYLALTNKLEQNTLQPMFNKDIEYVYADEFAQLDIGNFSITATIDGNDLSFSEDEYVNTYIAAFDSIPIAQTIDDLLMLYPYNLSVSGNKKSYTITVKIESESFETIEDTIQFNVSALENKAANEHITWLNNNLTYRTTLHNAYGSTFVNLKDTDEYKWSKYSTFDFDNYYEIVVADMLIDVLEVSQLSMPSFIPDVIKEFLGAKKKVLSTINTIRYEKYTDYMDFSENAVEKFFEKESKFRTDGIYAKDTVYQFTVKLFGNTENIDTINETFAKIDKTKQFLKFANLGKNTAKGIIDMCNKISILNSFKNTSDSLTDVFIQLYNTIPVTEYKMREAVADYINYAQGGFATTKEFLEKFIALNVSVSLDVLQTFAGKSMLEAISGLVINWIGTFPINGVAFSTTTTFATISSTIGSLFTGVAVELCLLDLLSNSSGKSAELGKVIAMSEYTPYIVETVKYYQNKLSTDKNDAAVEPFENAFALHKSSQVYVIDHMITALELKRDSVIEKLFNREGDYEGVLADLLSDKTEIAAMTCHGNIDTIVRRTKVIAVKCPVDVYIYDKDGALLAQIIDNTVTFCADGIEVCIAESEKFIALPADQEYEIEIIATDEGTMDYKIFEFDENSQMIRKAEKNNIPLVAEQSFTGVITSYSSETTDGKEYTLSSEETEYIPEFVPTHIHSEEVIPAVEATCTKTGLTEGKKCSVCGEVLVEQEEIPVIDHTDTDNDGLCDTCGEAVEVDLILGDIDNDGNITSADARTALRAAVGLDGLNEAQRKAADVNKDGILNSADARSILRCAVGLETF